MSITPIPAPEPDEVARGLAELELYVAKQVPATPLSSPPPAPAPAVETGLTKRVRRLRAQVAEARLLLGLQNDDTPLLVDTRKVRRRRKKSHEAARLYELAQDPAMQVYQTMRVRRWLVTVALASLTLALAWSTAGVQAFAADGAAPGTPSWLFAWLVEPFLSLGLLLVVGARAYLGTRGTALDDPKIRKIEVLFLGLTLGMNAWPYLPVVAEEFSMARLVLHILGPVVAVAIVTVLPIILAAFTGLDTPIHDLRNSRPDPSPVDAPMAADQQWRTPEETPSAKGARGRTAEEHRAELRRLIASGQLPPVPSARAIQHALNCREELSRLLRNELRQQAGGAA